MTLNKFAMSVCLSVSLCVRSCFDLRSWNLARGRVWRAGGNRQLFVATRQVKGHPQVKSSRNALWLPNLVSRTPDHSVVHCWGQRSCRVIWDQPRVKLLRNTLWPLNLLGRIPDQSVMHCWGQRSCRGQLGSSRVNLLSNAL